MGDKLKTQEESPFVFVPKVLEAAAGDFLSVGGSYYVVGSGGYLTINLTGGSVGETIFAQFFGGVSGYSTPPALTVTDNNGNSYTQDGFVSSGDLFCALFRSQPNVTIPNKLTVSVNVSPSSGQVGFDYYIDCFKGIPSSPLEKTVSNTGSGTTPNISITLSNPDDLLIGLLASRDTITSPAGFTNLSNKTPSTSGFPGYDLSYKVPTSGQMVSWSNSASNPWVGLVASYENVNAKYNQTFPSGYTRLYMTPSNSVNGVISDGCDLGSSPRTSLFEWRAQIDWNAAGSYAIDDSCEIYLMTSKDSYSDGNIGSGDKTFSDNGYTTINLQHIGRVYKDGSNPSISSGRTIIKERYCAAVLSFYNAGANNGTDLWPNNTYFSLIPIPIEEE